MSEEPKVERNIADELNRLGKQVADAIKAAWESEDRKKLQSELTDGFQKFGAQVTEAMDKASESETAKELRVKAEKVAADIRDRGVVDDVRKGILTGLDTLNRELSKLVEKLESKPAAEAPEAPEAPAGPPHRKLPPEPKRKGDRKINGVGSKLAVGAGFPSLTRYRRQR